MNEIFYRPFLCLAVSFSLISSVLRAQPVDYTNRINQLQRAIDTYLRDGGNGLYFETTDSAKRENPHSWLWPLCAYIQAANEMETAEPGKHYMRAVEKAIDQYYSDQPPVPAYQDYVWKERKSSRFYDDNQWVAIAYLDAYNRTHGRRYLRISKMIYRFIVSGIDTAAGGGVYWKEGDKTTKNTCSNGPGILVALQLYKITGDASYLRTGLALYDWVNTRLRSPEGLFYDNIHLPSLRVDKALYTYNAGSMLQANVLLYDITRDRKYLDEAERIAKAGQARFFRNGRLPGNYWFNAVLLRGYEALAKVDGDRGWIDLFREDAEAIWQEERDGRDMVGPDAGKAGDAGAAAGSGNGGNAGTNGGTGAHTGRRLIDQAAMIEIFARLARLLTPPPAAAPAAGSRTSTAGSP